MTMPLAARQRKAQLVTTIGVIPPCFLRRAVRLAPKKKGQMDGGVAPSNTGCMKEMRAERRT